MFNDFEFEMELAALTGDMDRRDVALLKRFDNFRPFDMAFFGDWAEELREMFDRLGHPNN